MSLIAVIQRGNIKEALAMISRGQGLEERDGFQSTPLHCACRNGHTEVAMALIKRGADIDAKDKVSKYFMFFIFNFSTIDFV